MIRCCLPRSKVQSIDMRSLLVLFLALVPGLVFSQTDVSGTQSGTWTADDSPYHVVGEIVVPDGQALLVEPGVEVIFQGHYKFTVNGYLEAVGAENDTIRFTADNHTTGWGGIRISSGDISRLEYCRIEFGKTAGEYPDMHGGGLALLGSDAVVSHCVFADNDATADNLGMGGAVYGSGTGSYDEPLTRFTDCRFIRNHCYGEGGAIKFTGDANTEITNCEFIQNDCLYGGGAISGYSIYGTKLINCLFVDNYTMYSGGGAVGVLGSGNTLYLANCTFTGNSAVTGDGGGLNLAYTEAFVANTIVYDNPGMYSDDFHLDWGSNAEIHYSNLTMPSGATGGNNMDVDPLFVDALNYDFHLTEASDCIDAGTDYIVLNGETLVDMTAEEYCGTAPEMGAYESCSVSGVEDRTMAMFEVDQNHPNPFSTRTAVSYRLAAETFVSATVYDVRGRAIRTLISTRQAVGPHAIVWDGLNNSGRKVGQGLYFMRLQAGDQSRSVRMLLTR